ncbi:uncharacterized protein KD926_002068 [Aspergillus affinis]|uniref:uncharacterized protein n=1 Tax=Aspergillus affinis TaxID=1070780 RepID=UPI0022FF3636|nr:uncharacterized protein KD926_002068 [Aspergillus affinis]KAI9036305.1 hypothetical protein KD926_002068 [Aspergillus affinis]
MERKRYATLQKPYSATDALKRLIDKAESLSLRVYLTKSEKNSLRAALTILQTETNGWKRQRYQLYLRSLLKECGAHAVLLCAVALGQVIVANMNQQNRDRLGGIFKTDTRLSGTVIRKLAAVECNLPESTQSPRSGSEGFQQPGILTEKTPSGNAMFDTYEQAAMLPGPQPSESINGRRERKNTDNQFEAKYILEPAFTYSKASVDLVPQLGELMYQAIENSQQWKMERAAGEGTTDCFATIIPEDTNADISITLLVGQRAAWVDEKPQGTRSLFGDREFEERAGLETPEGSVDGRFGSFW